MTDLAPTILITGATGFLGSAIVAHLLESRPDVRPLILVRASDPMAGLVRVQQAVAKMLDDPERIHQLSTDSILCGSLGSAESTLRDERAIRITHVINAAALASFAWKPEIWAVNIEETTAFARASARLPALKRFLHVGTAMISGDTAGRVLHEDDFPGRVRHFVPYTKSKAEIEHLLPDLLGPVPCVIARPSIVVGHTREGCRASPSIFWVFRMIHAAGMVPFPPSNVIDVIPVDFCARALVHLALKDTLQFSRYHVSAGVRDACSFSDIDHAYARSLDESHKPLTQFGIETLGEIESRYSDWFGPCDIRRMTSVIKLYRAFAGLNVQFDNTRLLSEGIGEPPRFTDYIDVCRRTSESMPIAEQMLYDFR